MHSERLKRTMILLTQFFKIGLFTFGGGWSIVTQMQNEFVDKRRWVTEEELLDQGIKPNTIRLSIGTEHIDDILADLQRGFDAVKEG